MSPFDVVIDEGRNCNELIRVVLEELRSFLGTDYEQEDDLTLVVIDITLVVIEPT